MSTRTATVFKILLAIRCCCVSGVQVLTKAPLTATTTAPVAHLTAPPLTCQAAQSGFDDDVISAAGSTAAPSTAAPATIAPPAAAAPKAGPAAATPSPVKPQLILTGRDESLSDLPEAVRSNVERTLALNPDLKERFLGDKSCLSFLDEHDPELAAAFRKERRGNYRGDICRAAVLFVEGGIYVDLDVQPEVPFKEMAGSATFVATIAANGDILNALMIAQPRSPVLESAISAMKRYYKGEYLLPRGHDHMGPYTLGKGFFDFWNKNCGSLKLELDDEHHCAGQIVRLYVERKCKEDAEECPPVRAKSKFSGVKFGMFDTRTQKVVAWSRFEACDSLGCGAHGWELS